MAKNLGLCCHDNDKQTDFETWSDPYLCCDQSFTNTSALEMHKMMFHGRTGAESRRGGGSGSGGGGKKKGNGGGGKNKGKGKATAHPLLTAAPPITTPFEDSFSDDEDDDDYNSSDYDSEDDYITGMMAIVALSTKPLTKCKKYRSEMNDAYKARFPYSCDKCRESFSVKPEYLLHMVVIHRECGACMHNGRADQMTGELWDHDHFKSSPSCLYSSKGEVGRGGDVATDGSGVVEINKTSKDKGHPDKGDRLICVTCGHNPGSGSSLNQHYATAHTKCRICKIQFDTQDDLQHHFLISKVHLGKYCHGCKMVFSSKGGFSDHCDALHSPWKNDQPRGLYACDACTKVPRSFPTEDELEAHLEFEHVRCFPCKREFSEKKNLEGHLTASSKHKFCIRCQSDFVSSESFRSHDCPGKNWLKGLFVDGSMDDRPKASAKSQDLRESQGSHIVKGRAF